MVKDDKPIPDGVFWMVWDVDNVYEDRVLCPESGFAKSVAFDRQTTFPAGHWLITKVKVTSL